MREATSKPVYPRASITVLSAFIVSILLPIFPAFADTPLTRRAAQEASFSNDVMLDLAVPEPSYQTELQDRSCLDGRSVKDFQGDVVEYWVNLECPFCEIAPAVQAQRNALNICIVVRHIPTYEYRESLKKALSYEALRKFSVNAANLFWDKVLPRTEASMPLPYEGSLLAAFQEAAITPESFANTLSGEATTIVSQDVMAAQGRIKKTPTYVLAGIRFQGCPFKAPELLKALGLAKEARKGNQGAIEEVIRLISNANTDEQKL